MMVVVGVGVMRKTVKLRAGMDGTASWEESYGVAAGWLGGFGGGGGGGGGGTERIEAVRARSQYGVLDTVSEDSDGGGGVGVVSRRTSDFVPGDGEASQSEGGDSLI